MKNTGNKDKGMKDPEIKDSETKSEVLKDCEIIRDLMPTYVDGLASESTTKMIEEHVSECDECRRMLENMRDGAGIPQAEAERDAKEIDFLKKSRKKGRRAVVLGVVLALVAAMAAAGIKVYMIGSEYKGDLACDIDVNGNTMDVRVTAADSLHVIRSLDFTMDNGVAQGTVRAVMPGVYHSSGTFTDSSAENSDLSSSMITCDLNESFSFSEDIKEVRIGDRVYWAGGRKVSAKAASVFSAGHEYIGDVSENGALLNALGITYDLGSLYSELKTDSEPYVWTIILDEDQVKYNSDYLKSHLRGYGYVLLGSVGNLSEVDFRYTMDGKTVVEKITADDASAFLGRDIKTCRSDAGALSELLEKTGLE